MFNFFFFINSLTIRPPCVQKVRQKNQEMKVLMDQMRNLLWDVNAMLTLRKWWAEATSLFAVLKAGLPSSWRAGCPSSITTSCSSLGGKQLKTLPFDSLPCCPWGERHRTASHTPALRMVPYFINGSWQVFFFFFLFLPSYFYLLMSVLIRQRFLFSFVLER